MAGKRKIIESAGDTRQTYFSHETTSFENKGSRTLRPLFPFVISGGKNTERYYFRHISDTTIYKFNVVPEYFGMESGYTEIFPDRIKKILKYNPDAQIFAFLIGTLFVETRRRLRNTKFLSTNLKPRLIPEQLSFVQVCPVSSIGSCCTLKTIPI